MADKEQETNKLEILQEWIARNPWLKEIVESCGKLDGEFSPPDGYFLNIRTESGDIRPFTISISEQDSTWIQTKREIALPAIASFSWKAGICGVWNKYSMHQIRRLANPENITMSPMYDDRYDILLIKISGTGTIIALDNRKLAKHQADIETNHTLNIKPANDSDPDGMWRMAFYALPISHPAIVESMIFGPENMKDVMDPSVNTRKCERCGKPVPDRVRSFSRRNFNRHVYCMKCQVIYREEKRKQI